MFREFRFLATEFVARSKPQAEIIIVKRPIQGHNNVPRVWVNTDYAIRVVAKTALALLATLLGNSQEDSWFLLIIKKISCFSKAIKIFIFVRFNFRGSKRGVIS